MVHIPLLGEITMMRACFLFLSPDIYGVRMLLSNLADKMTAVTPRVADVGPAFVVTFAVIGYSAVYLERMRMMIFLSLISLVVPVYKHHFCRMRIHDSVDNLRELPVRHEAMILPGSKVELSASRVLPTCVALMVSLYIWDGLSWLTSSTLFIVVLPEFTQRLPKFPSPKNVLFYLTVLLLVLPIGALVTGAIYFEKEFKELPEEYKSVAKRVLGARPESVPDYYAIIGVRRGADPGKIKKAFRELSKVYHPDKTAGDPELHERFVRISEAVRKLTGKSTDRAAYYKEVEIAELKDMVVRSAHFVMFFGLWAFNVAFRTVLSFAGKKQDAGGSTNDGTPKGADRSAPLKPLTPLRKVQKGREKEGRRRASGRGRGEKEMGRAKRRGREGKNGGENEGGGREEEGERKESRGAEERREKRKRGGVEISEWREERREKRKREGGNGSVDSVGGGRERKKRMEKRKREGGWAPGWREERREKRKREGGGISEVLP